MSTRLRRTPATLAVLAELSSSAGPIWGLQIVRETGRPAGSVYPILARLEEAGWVESAWETDQAHSGPRRRYYTLTDDGRARATAMLAPATPAPAAIYRARLV
ncbi:PadR family transcriptional regulator [Rhodococcus sp. AG1013]|uniref:PadR family transcriptional regulator n=1 Tax=unclassified Rhodococcus (in: high G+C Gram-positive bacteria) TaxID=192944 RepID=UPI000E0CAC43|nr:PadR family transcriptional regulator [Rhodococcus sp. AG1013]RDI32672.1 PadR family transcriptional regulator [Rhodococcus sp. AG1013]